MITLNVAKDFSKAPGPRYRKDGAYSAEEFREEHLLPKLKQAIEQKCKLTVELDGTFGYASSWLDEVFGQLAVIYNYDNLRSELFIASDEDPFLSCEIWDYIYINRKKSQ